MYVTCRASIFALVYNSNASIYTHTHTRTLVKWLKMLYDSAMLQKKIGRKMKDLGESVIKR